MTHRSPAVPLWLRLVGLIILISLLIWIPFEDLGLQSVLMLSAAISAWLAVRFLLNHVASDRRMVMWHAVLGCLAGLAITLLAFLLMLLKSGLHGHTALDFTVDQFYAVFRLTPFLALSGLLIGLGFGLWRAVR